MSRSPDYHLKAVFPGTDNKWSKVGAAWRNEDGSFSLVLEPFVVLSGAVDMRLRLFKDGPQGRQTTTPPEAAPLPRAHRPFHDDMDDDIPF